MSFFPTVMCLLCVPFTPINSFTGEWLFGETLCILFPVTQGMSVYISTLTLTIIALDRFVVIIFPYRARMQIKTCCLMIAMIDFLAILFTAPYAFHMKISIGKCRYNHVKYVNVFQLHDLGLNCVERKVVLLVKM